MSDELPEFDFDSLKAEMFADTANGLLAKQIGLAKQWIGRERAAGREPTQMEFTRKCAQEPNTRAHVLTAYCAALWKAANE